MPDPRRDQRAEPTAEDLDLEVAVDEQGAPDADAGAAGDGSQDDAAAARSAQEDPPFITPRAGDSLSPDELRREP